MKQYKIPKNFSCRWDYCKYHGTSTYNSVELAISEDNHKFSYNLYSTNIARTYIESNVVLIGDK